MSSIEIEKNFKYLSKWLKTEQAQKSYKKWLQIECNSDDSSDCDDSDAYLGEVTELDKELSWRVGDGGWIKGYKFIFASNGRCVSMKHEKKYYYRSRDDDPRNGDGSVSGLFFFRKLDPEEDDNYDIEKVRVYVGMSFTQIDFRRGRGQSMYWELINKVTLM